MSNKDKQVTRKRRLRRFGLGLTFCVCALVLAATVAAILAIGTRLTAPDWLHQRIAQRINANLPNYQLAFGDMSMVVSDDLVPRLLLRDVALSGGESGQVANLSELEITVAPSPLLEGKVQASAVRLSGLRLILRRRAEGDLAIALEGPATTGPEGARFANVTDQIDAIFSRPQFAALNRVEAGNLTLRYEDARAGRAWSVDGGRVVLTRDGGQIGIRGDVALLGARDYATTLELSYSGEIGRKDAEFGVKFDDMPSGDISGQSPALAWLDALDAPISGALRASVDGAGRLGPLSATLQIGAGVLQPTPATAPIAFQSARSYFTYDPVANEIRFTELSVDSKWVTAQAEGTAFLVGMEDGWPRELQAQIRVSNISANPAEFYPEPILLDRAAADIRLQLDPFVLSVGELSLADQGQHFVLDGVVRGKTDGWDLALNGRMGGLAPERLMELWPLSLKPKTRKWISENVQKADLGNIQLALRATPDNRPDVFLGFDFKGLQTRFLKDVPPIREGAGHASIYDNRFVITAESGHVVAAQGGRIDIAGTSFIIPDVRLKKGPARTRLHTESTVTAALSLLDEKPFRFLSKAGQPVTLADGRATLSGQLDLLLKPKLTPAEVAFDVTGTLEEVRSETLVKDRVLAASALQVRASNAGIEIGGDARIGRVPVSGAWRLPLGEGTGGDSSVSGVIELSEQFADEFNIGLPPGSISGAGEANIEISFAKDQPGQFVLTSDLAGVGLGLQQLSWSLPPAATGQLEVAGTIGEPPEIERLDFTGGGLEANGRVTLHASGDLDRAAFSRVRIGDWLDAPVTLVGRGAGQSPRVEVRGGMIDLRQTSLSGEGGGASEGGPVSLRLDHLQVSDGIALNDFSAELDTTGGTDGNFTGKVNGFSVVTGRVVPMDGRSAFRIQSEDAGGVLRSAGLLKQARKGKMDLILTPAPEPGSYDGVLGIDQFRIKEAPALSALLNTISVVGLLEQLNGEGLHFSRVDAKFRLTPERLTLLQGSAVGAALGVSMDGYYFMESGQMDMQGVVSPVYMVNAIGGIFNRAGEGLIGFNYTLKGAASDPRVSVNPLSALAPGFLREIFRRPAPVLGDTPGAVTSGQDRPDEAEPPAYQRQDR
ncbi:AsmA-like C-terminal region-containing protein [uncultured Roseovarius sp.]|uniref:YhdP family protein n=1 Tax=Roseovarius sp. TaxID=1486281 RepID=UPI0025D3D76F|nr:AsmA-like C-terminal region-containing protein [uncultured Roseovarius sp.]